MKKRCIIICAGLCLCAMAEEIKVGDSSAHVLAVMGEPEGKAASGKQEVFYYQTGQITLEDGRVATINIQPNDEGDIKNLCVLGRSKAFCAKKYGLADTNAATVARNKFSPLISLPGAETQSYRVNDRWKVRISFLNGAAQRMVYEKSYQQGERYKIQPDEFSAVLKAQADGLAWEKATMLNLQKIIVGALVNPQGRWIRTDGVIAYEQGLSILFETKTILNAEAQAKQQKELERKQNIPSF